MQGQGLGLRLDAGPGTGVTGFVTESSAEVAQTVTITLTVALTTTVDGRCKRWTHPLRRVLGPDLS